MDRGLTAPCPSVYVGHMTTNRAATITNDTLIEWQNGHSRGHKRAVPFLRPLTPQQRAIVVGEAHTMMNNVPGVRFPEAVEECARHLPDTYPAETLRATWTMRLRFRDLTDSEFADMLTALSVPNALDMVHAARFWDYANAG